MGLSEKARENARKYAREYMADRYRNDPEFREHAKRKAKEWAKANPERRNAQKKRRREWLRQNDPEEYRRQLAVKAALTRKWQAKNKEHQSAYQKQRLGERITMFKQIKEERGCQHCGIRDWRCLDFHHRDPESKEFNLSQAKGKPIPELEAEIAKCDVVCSNCHRIHHTSKDWT